MSRKQSTVAATDKSVNRLEPTAHSADWMGSMAPMQTQPSESQGDFARLLVSLTARLLNTKAENLDERIRQTLSSLGHLTGADGCYLYQFSEDGSAIIKEHLWGAGEAIPFQYCHGRLTEDFPVSLTSLRWHEVDHRVPDDTPDDIRAERQRLFERSGVRSLVNIPLLACDGPIGALGLVTARTSLGLEEGSIKLLKTLGYVVADALVRVRLEAELRTDRDGFLRLLSGLNEVMYRISIPEIECLYIGPAAKAVFGYSAEEFRSNPTLIREIIHPEFRSYFRKRWTNLLAGKVPKSYEYRIIDPQGRERWVHQSNNLILDDQGRPVAIEGICRSITEQKAVEAALRASEERFRAITENAADMILIMSRLGELSYITPSVERVLGYCPHEVLGKSFEEFVHPDDLALAMHTFEKILSTPGETLQIPDLRVRHSDGRWLWFEGLVSNLLDYAAVNGLVINYHDITRRKQAEDAFLRVQERLEERVDERTRELAEANARLKLEQRTLNNRTVALQEVLGQVEAGRTELARQVQANVDKIALPILDTLTRTGTDADEHYIRLLRSCLKDIIAPLAHYLDRTFPELTPREQEICHMVKDGFSCKDIAATLHIAVQTVIKQRKTIRRKLGLSNKKVNLASFLRSLA